LDNERQVYTLLPDARGFGLQASVSASIVHNSATLMTGFI